jgi:hypothetical protein
MPPPENADPQSSFPEDTEHRYRHPAKTEAQAATATAPNLYSTLLIS